jgi:hypothetical protein
MDSHQKILSKERTVMIIGFTGTRHGMHDLQIRALRYILIGIQLITDISEVHHGDCMGADEMFHNIIIKYFNNDLRSKHPMINIKIHPPVNESNRARCQPGLFGETLPAKEYLERNKDIVEACDMLIATPKEMKEIIRSGTWSTIRYARKMKKSIIIVYPDGSVEKD